MGKKHLKKYGRGSRQGRGGEKPPFLFEKKPTKEVNHGVCAKDDSDLQPNTIKANGWQYLKNALVFCYPNGIPMEERYIRRRFNKLIEDKGLPKVVFHSLRHSSITYKLKMTGGDIKAVQGDSGHSQVDMITEVYAHILDESRIKNAEIFEEQFYADRKVEEKPIEKAKVSSIDITKSMTEEELIVKKLSENPEAIKLMKQLLDKTGAKEETKVE